MERVTVKNQQCKTVFPSVRADLGRVFAITSYSILLSLSGGTAWAQTSLNQTPNPPSVGQASTSPTGQASDSSAVWYVQDPVTGRVYRQQFGSAPPSPQSVLRPVERTVYVPQTTLQTVQIPNITYRAETNYELQPRVVGWWNPFRQPTVAWRSVPVTRWRPEQTSATAVVPRTQMVPTKQHILEPTTVTAPAQQQLVSVEVPRATNVLSPNAHLSDRQLASRGDPTARPGDNLLSRQSANSQGVGRSSKASPPATHQLAQRNTAPSTGWQPAFVAPPPNTLTPGTNWGSPSSLAARSPGQLPLPASNFLRAERQYQAPLQTASVPATQLRDTGQAGMTPTILR